MLLLRSRIPWLIADVIGQIVRGSGPRLAIVIAIMLPAICIIWIAAASLGRAATLKALLRREASVSLAPQFGLSFLRASVTVAALIGYLGALIVAGRAAGAGDEVRAGIFLVVFVALATAVAAVRSRLNWFLSWRAISAARDGSRHVCRRRCSGHRPFPAPCREVCRRGRRLRHDSRCVVRLLHSYQPAGIGAGRQRPPGVSLFFLAAITLAYFALVDAVYIARLAAYVAIDERRPQAAARAGCG